MRLAHLSYRVSKRLRTLLYGVTAGSRHSAAGGLSYRLTAKGIGCATDDNNASPNQDSGGIAIGIHVLKRALMAVAKAIQIPRNENPAQARTQGVRPPIVR